MKKRFNPTFIPISDDESLDDDNCLLDPRDFLVTSLHQIVSKNAYAELANVDNVIDKPKRRKRKVTNHERKRK